MPRLSRLLPSVVPPLVVVAAIGAVLSRAWSSASDRSVREDAIHARWAARSDFDALARDLDGFLADYGADPEARWLVAEAHARIGRPEKAFEAVFGDPRTRGDRRTPRRFATLLLSTLATMPGTSDMAPLAVRALLARIDAGDDAARADLFARVRAMKGFGELVPWFKAAHRAPTASRQALADALGSREDVNEYRIAAGGLECGPKQKRLLPLLLEVVQSEEWRTHRFPSWRHVCRAVGSTRDPLGEAALRQVRESVTGEGGEAALQREALDVGLALTEDAPARDRVEALLALPDLGVATAELYAVGLATRWVQGDASAGPRLRDLWRSVPWPLSKLMLGYSVLLADVAPPPEVPVDEWVAALANGSDAAHRVLAVVWRYRRRAPGALEASISELDRAIHAAHLYEGEADETENGTAVLEILRAWARWS